MASQDKRASHPVSKNALVQNSAHFTICAPAGDQALSVAANASDTPKARSTYGEAISHRRNETTYLYYFMKNSENRKYCLFLVTYRSM